MSFQIIYIFLCTWSVVASYWLWLLNTYQTSLRPILFLACRPEFPQINHNPQRQTWERDIDGFRAKEHISELCSSNKGVGFCATYKHVMMSRSDSRLVLKPLVWVSWKRCVTLLIWEEKVSTLVLMNALVPFGKHTCGAGRRCIVGGLVQNWGVKTKAHQAKGDTDRPRKQHCCSLRYKE